MLKNYIKKKKKRQNEQQIKEFLMKESKKLKQKVIAETKQKLKKENWFAKQKLLDQENEQKKSPSKKKEKKRVKKIMLAKAGRIIKESKSKRPNNKWKSSSENKTKNWNFDYARNRVTWVSASFYNPWMEEGLNTLDERRRSNLNKNFTDFTDWISNNDKKNWVNDKKKTI